MNGVKYILMGMGFMALLIVGSCSMLTYKAVEVAGNSGDAIERIEKAADRQLERERSEEFYREAAYRESNDPNDWDQ